jgi:hypothetical protein
MLDGVRSGKAAYLLDGPTGNDVDSAFARTCAAREFDSPPVDISVTISPALENVVKTLTSLSTTWPGKQFRNQVGIPRLSQQIAAWKLLYRVQHPARYVSRLQTIPSSNIETIVIPMIDRQEVWSDVARIDPAADR